MLDIETRRRIDTARDILVGKVPDPKSQVEQITIALIYKFMDDMDAESEEFGGKRKFFAGDFAHYGWAKLMRSGLGGHETLNLYAEAITRMPENPGIPPLFRDIFKNAYLPYRDPETLKMFLKVIDEFSYDHSERLGDAFEYLLSVLGSQGDAGQFRTPRHIIDFMVEVVDPKKTDTILDPACGTAGFLISSWKHILKANLDENGISKLTPDERGRLANSINGYDISPDMVRLSLVNMYLHGFASPHISEYDTLTSLDKWSEYADMILANPPFMSPKGGIRPHNRFSIQSSRSEVLFVDYMAEHLTPKGRAAIIVPEGIIFQSGTAYKNLRKMLVEEYLVSVISLPAGVFNPYSGVKTSILILDKSMAKKTDTIAFFKVANDGFNLGAQRREIEQNDLPKVQLELKEYFRRIQSGELITDYRPSLGLMVSKEKINKDNEFILSLERYRNEVINKSSFPAIALRNICELVRGVVYEKSDEVTYGGNKVLRANNIDRENSVLNLQDVKLIAPKNGFSNEKKLRKNDIFICLASGSKDHIGKAAFINQDTDYFFGGFMGVIRTQENLVDAHYLFRQLITGKFNKYLRDQISGANINNLSSEILYQFSIPLPPLEIQQQFVTEIEGYQKVIDSANSVICNYHPRIPINPDWQIVSISEICEINPKKSEVKDLPLNTQVSFLPMEDINEHNIQIKLLRTRSIGDVYQGYTYFKDNDVLVAKVTPCFENGKGGIAKNLLNGIGFGSSELYILRSGKSILPEYLFWVLQNENFFRNGKLQMTGTGGLQRVPRVFIENYQIPLPPLPVQQSIVVEIEAEQALVAANRELITRLQKKIDATLYRIWGEEEIPSV